MPDHNPQPLEMRELSWVYHDAWSYWFRLKFDRWPESDDFADMDRLGPAVADRIRLEKCHLLAVLEALRDGKPVSVLALADHEQAFEFLKVQKALIANGEKVWLATDASALARNYVRINAGWLLDEIDSLRNDPKIQAIRKQFAEDNCGQHPDSTPDATAASGGGSGSSVCESDPS